MELEAALHRAGRVASAAGLALLAPLAVIVLARQQPAARATALLLGAASCLSVGWGLRCAFEPGALSARSRRRALAAGGLLAALLALLPWLLPAGARGA